MIIDKIKIFALLGLCIGCYGLGYSNASDKAKAEMAVGGHSFLSYTDDGLNWTNPPITLSSDYVGELHYLDGKFVIPDNGSLVVSTDGRQWGRQTASNLPGAVPIVTGNGVWAGFSTKGNYVTSTDNGLTWQSRSLPNNSGYELVWAHSAFYDGQLHVAITSTVDHGIRHYSAVYTSKDAITWDITPTTDSNYAIISKTGWDTGVWFTYRLEEASDGVLVTDGNGSLCITRDYLTYRDVGRLPPGASDYRGIIKIAD